MLLICILLWICQDAVSVSTIETIPPSPSNVLASGYPGLIVRAQIELGSLRYCYWYYTNAERGGYDGHRWYFDECEPKNDTKITISCSTASINGTSYLLSNLTLQQTVSPVLDVYVYCYSNRRFVFNLPSKSIEDCPKNLADNVVITSTNSTYNASGMFDCSNNGRLFYSNGSPLSNNLTTCSVSATWNGQENLQCWRAPVNSNIKENLTIIAGTKINITCEYDEVTPTGNMIKFYYGNNTIEKSMNETLTLNVNIKDNNKEIYCQVVTPYTIIYNDTGKSPPKMINVLYTPYQKHPTTCEWQANEEGSCEVKFKANPRPQFIGFIKNGLDVENDVNNSIWFDSNDQVIEHYLFRFRKTNVTHTDQGQYTLILQSSSFPNNHSINFTIDVPQPSSLTQTILIVACSVLGFLLVVVVLVFIFTTCRCTKKRKRAERYQNSMKSDSSFHLDLKTSKPKLSQKNAEPADNVYFAPISATDNTTVHTNPNARKSGSHFPETLNSTNLKASQHMAESTDSLYITPNSFEENIKAQPSRNPRTSDSHFPTFSDTKFKSSRKMAVSSESLYIAPDQNEDKAGNPYRRNDVMMKNDGDDGNGDIYQNTECEDENIYENN